MTHKILYGVVIAITLVFSGPSLAGKGGGSGISGPGHQRGGGMTPEQDITRQRRSDKATQQDRDREQYRGSEAERDKQKAKAKGLGTESGKGDQTRTLKQDRVQEHK